MVDGVVRGVVEGGGGAGAHPAPRRSRSPERGLFDIRFRLPPAFSMRLQRKEDRKGKRGQ